MSTMHACIWEVGDAGAWILVSRWPRVNRGGRVRANDGEGAGTDTGTAGGGWEAEGLRAEGLRGRGAQRLRG